MLRVICVRTGDKFDSWYEDNLKYKSDEVGITKKLKKFKESKTLKEFFTKEDE